MKLKMRKQDTSTKLKISLIHNNNKPNQLKTRKLEKQLQNEVEKTFTN